MITAFFQSLSYGAGRWLCNLTLACLVLAGPAAATTTLVAFGDSLTEGYGLPPGDGFVPQLQAWLTAQGQDVTVVNAGVSGDTTAGGLARLDWTLTPDVQAMIVNFGGNDMLRGTDPAEARRNLDGILKGATSRGIKVLLVGMQSPGNYGPDYKAAFDAIYPDLAARYRVDFFPSFFGPLIGNMPPDPAQLAPFFQADGLHPNQDGVTKIVEGIGPAVVQLLGEVAP